MSARRSVGVAAGVLLALAGLAQAADFYATGGGDPFSEETQNKHLYRIGTSPMSGTDLGLYSPTTSRVYGLANDTDGSLLGLRYDTLTNLYRIVRIDPATRVMTTICSWSAAIGGGTGMEVAADGTVYVSLFNRLVTVNRTSGALTFLPGSPTFSTGILDLAFDDSGVLWGTSGSRLYTFDLTSGVPTLRGSFQNNPISGAPMTGIAFDHGVLYTSTWESNSRIWSVNLTPGASFGFMTSVGSTGLPFVSDLENLPNLNQAPTAFAGTDQTVPPGVPVVLSGAGSSDPDGNALTYRWTGDFVGGTATGVSPTVTFSGALGAHTVTLVVNDGQLDSAPDTMVVTIQDSIAPSVTITSPAAGAIVGTSPVALFVQVVDATQTQVVAGTSSATLAAGGGTASLSATLVPGPNTITATATDAGGNSASATITVVYDPDAPTVTIDAPANASVVGTSSVAVTAHVGDITATTVNSTPAGLSALLPAGGGPVSGTVPLANEGVNVVSVHATDAAGHVSGTSVEVIRDTTAPAVNVTSPAAGAFVGTGPVDVTVEVQDLTATTLDVGGVARNLAAGGGSVTVSVPLAAGVNDVAITATDAAGNATTLTRRIVLDLTAPVVTIDAPADGQRFGAGASPVAVTARVDDLSPTTVSSAPAGLSDSLPAGGGTALGALDLAEGTNTLTVSATDATGRTGSASVTVVLDTTAPSVSFAAPHDGDAVRGIIDLHFAADDPLPGSGVASVAVTLDGSALTTLTSSPFETTLDTTAFADGPHVLRATATDGLGNASALVPIHVVVDNTAPVVVITAPVEGSSVGGQVPFGATVSDAASGVAAVVMTVGGQAPTTDASRTYATPAASDDLHACEDTTRWPDGPAPFTVTVRDAAGNVATATVTVEIDNTQPTRSLVRPHDGDVVRGTITIEASASDAHLASLAVLVDGLEVATSATSPLLVPFNTATRIDGPMTVVLRVTDTAGNVGTSAANVTIDNVTFEMQPSLLHLKANNGGAPADATLTGPNLALLLPTESHVLELRVPGGTSVPAVQGWDGDDALSGPGLTRLRIRFSRAALVASIRAGIAGGHIDPAGRQAAVTLVADGRVLGTVLIGFTEGK